MTETKTLDPALAERARVLRVLHEQARHLRARGLTAPSLFGSIARGAAGSNSDIDLLIATDPAVRLGFFELFALREELEALLGRPVQFAFGREMRPWLRAWIEEDRIGVF